jgi:hypothetical protein
LNSERLAWRLTGRGCSPSAFYRNRHRTLHLSEWPRHKMGTGPEERRRTHRRSCSSPECRPDSSDIPCAAPWPGQLCSVGKFSTASLRMGYCLALIPTTKSRARIEPAEKPVVV